MKNIVKILTAVILSAVLCTGSVIAIAAESSDSLKWNYYDYDSGMYYFYDDYKYAGTLSEGKNTINVQVDDRYNKYYIFDVEKEGYYAISEYDFSYKVAADYVDGVAYGEAENEFVFGDAGYTEEVYHLSAGENIIGIDYFYYEENDYETEFYIEYLGKELTDITYEENAFKNLIEDYDIRISEEDSAAYAENIDFDVVFSEKTIECEDMEICIDINSETGEYSVSFLDYSEPVDVVICKPTDVVKSMEITNLDECLSGYEYYNESIYAAVPEAVKVVFADGSSKTYENTENDYWFIFEIETPDGRIYHPYVHYSDDGGKLYLEMEFAGETYGLYEVGLEEADVCDNLGEFNNDNDYRVEGAVNDIIYRWRNATSLDSDLTAAERAELLSGIIGACTNAVFQIFCNFIELLEYYF